MAFIIYSSSDVGAPQLNGQTGSLCRILSASLLSGYGSKTGAGWICAFSSSTTNPNRMVFRQPSGSAMYLNVDDSVTTDTRGSYLTGFEVATSIYSGSGQFPTYVQSPYGSGSVTSRKSVSTLATPVPWYVVVDPYTLYVFMFTGDSSFLYSWMFGDIYSTKVPDPYSACLIGRNVGVNNSTYQQEGMVLGNSSNGTLSNVGGNYMARSYTGLGGSIPIGKHGNGHLSAGLWYGIVPFPNPQDGSFWLSRLWISEGANSIRGHLRGLWQWLHPYTTNLLNEEILSGSGDLAGRTFMVLNYGNVSGVLGNSWYIIETSDTVETN